MSGLEWIRKAITWDDSDNGDWFMDNIGYGNAEIGELLTTPDGKYTFEVEDTYFRRIEDEEVWVVLRETETEQFTKVSASFTSWDSLEYKVMPTERTTKTIYVWS